MDTIYILKTSTVSVGIFNYEFTEFSVAPFFHAIIVEKQLITRYFDTLSYLQFSPYVQIQLIPVGVERSNGTPTGTSRLFMIKMHVVFLFVLGCFLA